MFISYPFQSQPPPSPSFPYYYCSSKTNKAKTVSKILNNKMNQFSRKFQKFKNVFPNTFHKTSQLITIKAHCRWKTFWKFCCSYWADLQTCMESLDHLSCLSGWSNEYQESLRTSHSGAEWLCKKQSHQFPAYLHLCIGFQILDDGVLDLMF